MSQLLEHHMWQAGKSPWRPVRTQSAEIRQDLPVQKTCTRVRLSCTVEFKSSTCLFELRQRAEVTVCADQVAHTQDKVCQAGRADVAPWLLSLRSRRSSRRQRGALQVALLLLQSRQVVVQLHHIALVLVVPCTMTPDSASSDA